MYNAHDDFDMMIQPEEIQCDNPIDEGLILGPNWGDEDDEDEEWDDDF